MSVVLTLLTSRAKDFLSTKNTRSAWSNTGKAYRCFCTAERLEAVRKAQTEAKAQTGYDRHCRDLDAATIERNMSEGKKFTIRFKAPLDGSTRFEDKLRGEVMFENKQLDDLVLLKSDGFPTYHLARSWMTTSWKSLT